ncbi:hypothetical protein [Acholeplasma hippikon]|uniref:Uncharacterized protein n=1 Tax=Acholeplasma hippikon TaxID=264636 RepID=A0A449BL66_9MOLU|nr:hypothetical protein [Acholeplasma hippikon]VEU83077.1 Uncharacterised protein [Acholeplasma hippikon]
MKVIKQILNFIFEPVRFVGSRNISNVIVKFFDKHKWLIYVLALVITTAVFIIYYI